MKGSDYFSKIIIDDVEIDIEELDRNNGIYTLPNNSNSPVRVEYVLKDNTQIPEYIFNNVSDITEIVLPSTIDIIGNNAFTGTSVGKIDMSAVLSKLSGTNIDLSIFNTINIPAAIEFIKQYVSTHSNTNVRELVLALYENINSNSQNSQSTNGNYINFDINDTFTFDLRYTDRSSEIINVQKIGECTIKIVEKFEEEFVADPFATKIQITNVSINNQYNNINHSQEILNKYFYIQNSVFYSDEYLNSSGIATIGQPIETFFHLKTSDSDMDLTLENNMGVTNYSILKYISLIS